LVLIKLYSNTRYKGGLLMGWLDIVTVMVAIVVVALLVVLQIRKKKKSQAAGGCASGCAGCPSASLCGGTVEKK
jgi:uncharacterized membrane protein